MAFLECNFHSVVLQKAVSMNIIIPQFPETRPEERKVMYLLHGLSDDASMWMRRTSIERYADRFNMIVIMPDGGRGFYTDAVNGSQYWTFLAEELPEIIRRLFQVSPARENCFAAGLSMGGYGAIKLGLRCPEKFAAVAGLSSLVDLRRRYRSLDTAGWKNEMRLIFGSLSQLAPRGNDLFDLARKLRESGKDAPEILSICGTEDFMIEDNRHFKCFMRKIEYPGFYSFERPGSHTWEFWDQYIQDVMTFFTTGEVPEE